MTAQAQFVLVPSDQLDQIVAKLDRLEKAIAGATITPAPQWLTIKAAAEKLGCNPSTIHRKIAAGELRAKGANKTRRVFIED